MEKIDSANTNLFVALLGEPNTGKSSFLKHSGGVKPEDNFKIGTSLKHKYLELDSKSIEFSVWDTSEQMCGPFLPLSVIKLIRNNDAVFCIYDVTDKSSLDGAIQYFAPIKMYTGSSPFVLIGSKVDLTEDRMVDAAYAEKVASDHAMHYFEVSIHNPVSCEYVFATVAAILMRSQSSIQ